MRSLILGAVCLGLVSAQSWAGDFGSERLHNWPHWRGPEANGVAPYGAPPLHWDEESHVRWKVEIPGLGNSTPIVWGDQVFVLTAVEAGKAAETAGTQQRDEAAGPSARQSNADRDEANTQRSRDGDRRRGRGGQRFGRRGRGRGTQAPTSTYQFIVLCLDRKTGDVRWKRVANELVPHEGFRTGDNSFASGSPTTDGRYLYASFGSYGIYCYDLDGNLVWQRDLGDMRTRNGFGEGTSPTIYENRLIVTWDHEGQSQIFGLDATTGEIVWQVERDEPTSWATPLVIEHNGRAQVVTNATNRVRSYDLQTGELIWQCGGQTTNAIPSPVSADGTVYCMTGFRGNALYAIPLDAQGDLTGSGKFAWHYDGETAYRPGTPYVPSPLLYGDLLYYTKSNNAILSCVNAKTGEVIYDDQRLPGLGTIYASPVGAADRVYLVDRDGATIVFKRGPQFEVLATNKLNDSIDASPVIVGDELFLRGKNYLYSIAAD